MQNYFNYFTEIEEHFQRRRGSLLMLSTLDWALIETWREAGIPLEAVLRGIDTAFDKYDARRARAKNQLRRVNGLAWCAQEVMAAVEQMKEAATGASNAQKPEVESGFEAGRIAAYLNDCAGRLEAATLNAAAPYAAALNATAAAATLNATAAAATLQTANRLRELAASLHSQTVDSPTAPAPLRVEDLELNLTVLEEKLFATLMATAAEEELVALKQQAARELAPYRSKMNSAQIRQIEQQFLRKRLLEARRLPRLSLFYMSHD